MGLQQKAFKFKLKPNTVQAAQIQRTFGSARFVFNHFLARRSSAFKLEQKRLGYTATSLELTSLKRDLEWLQDVDKFALQNSLKDLDKAFANFFKDCKKPKQQRRFLYPRFKKKATARRSYRTNLTNNNIEIKSNQIKLPKLGWVRFSSSQDVTGKIISATVSQDATGKYEISINCETQITPYAPSQKTVGLDLGLKHFLTTSHGLKLEAPKPYKKALKQLRKASRILSRRTRGSARYGKAKTKLARIHARVANVRKDFLHKTSTMIIKEFGFIGLETLRVKNMVRNHCLAQSIMDAGWSEFARLLEYKGVWHERTVQKTDAFYRSSQLCSCCGAQEKAVKDLSVRVWTCSSCGVLHDRDENASINIENEAIRARKVLMLDQEALRIVAAGLSETLNAHGGHVSHPLDAVAVELGIPSLQ